MPFPLSNSTKEFVESLSLGNYIKFYASSEQCKAYVATDKLELLVNVGNIWLSLEGKGLNDTSLEPHGRANRSTRILAELMYSAYIKPEKPISREYFIQPVWPWMLPEESNEGYFENIFYATLSELRKKLSSDIEVSMDVIRTVRGEGVYFNPAYLGINEIK